MSKYVVKEALTSGEIARLKTIPLSNAESEAEFGFKKDTLFDWMVSSKPFLKETLIIYYIEDTQTNTIVGVLAGAEFVTPITNVATSFIYFSKAPQEYNTQMIKSVIQREKDRGIKEIKIETRNPKLYHRFGFKETGHVMMALRLNE